MTVFADVLKKYLDPNELSPHYGSHVDTRVVSMGEERVLGIISLQGCSFETTTDAALVRNFNRLQVILTEIAKINAPNLVDWFHIKKDRIKLDFNYKFENPFVTSFTDKYLSRFQGDDFFKVTYGVCFVLKYDFDIEQGIEKMNQLLDFALKSLDDYDPVALGVEYTPDGVLHSQIGRYLNRLLNRSDEIIPLSGDSLSESIRTASLHFGFDLCEIRPNSGGRIFATYYDLEMPQETKKAMWNTLLKEPYEFLIAQSFYNFTASKSLDLSAKTINKISSGTNYPAHYVEEIKEARQYISSGEITLGEHHGALIVYGRTPKEAVDNGNDMVTTLLGNSGCRFVRATSSGIYTYYSILPGAKNKPLAEPKTTRNVACAFSMNNYPQGKQKGNPIGDGSAIMPIPTTSGGVFWLNTHVSDPNLDVRGQKYPGHALLLGATGAGKTTAEGTIVAFLDRFKPGIFAIDFNKSMQMFLETYGTTYFDIEEGIDTGLNPFQLDDSPTLRAFLYNLVGACGRNTDGTLTANDERLIKNAVDTIMKMDLLDRGFSYISTLIPPQGANGLGDRLAKWQRSCNGKLAWALDSPINRFNPSEMHRIGFNTTSILKEGNPATEPVLSVLFFIKDLMQRSGQLFLTLVEEFWVPANFPTTQEQIRGSLKAGRIKGEFMFLVSQSPEDAINCEIFAAIVQQTPTKIFLPNPDATFESYQKCGLNKKEFDELHKLHKASRTMLIKQEHQSTFVKLDLSGFDDYLPIISGDWESIELAHAIKAEVGTTDPAVWVPIFQARHREIRNAKKQAQGGL